VIATPDLINRLAADASPVRRLRAPLTRAGLWLGLFVTVAGIVTVLAGAWPLMLRRLEEPRFAIEMAATFVTGAAAVIAAFYLSLPDRSRLWAILPLPALALWIGISGYGCYRNWLTYGPEGWALGRSSDCFIFILTMSMPVAALLYLALRRARPLDILSVTAVGGLGVAALAAATLQFFHPFDVTIVDLAVHVVAVLIVVAALVATGRFDRGARGYALAGVGVGVESDGSSPI
jgi:hypothetical protein